MGPYVLVANLGCTNGQTSTQRHSVVWFEPVKEQLRAGVKANHAI
jgi:hypothetical protein